MYQVGDRVRITKQKPYTALQGDQPVVILPIGTVGLVRAPYDGGAVVFVKTPDLPSFGGPRELVEYDGATFRIPNDDLAAV